MTRLVRVVALVVAFLIATPAHAATDYGSGKLGDWTVYSHCDTSCRGVDTATGRYVYSSSWDVADVGVIGDSITARGWGDLYPLVTKRGHKMSVNYWSARPTTPAVDWLLQRIAAGKRIPRVIVVMTGANDIYSPAVMGAQVRRLKAALPDSTKLYWGEVQVSRTKYSQTVQIADQRNSMAVNLQLYQNLEPSQVIRWSELFWSAPWRIPYYMEDGVHPKVGIGTRCWAAMVVNPLIAQGAI